MLVKTSSTKKEISLQERGDLSDLFAIALTLIRANKRSEFQRSNLRRALQLFAENRLAAIYASHTGALPEDLQQILSRPIAGFLSEKLARKIEARYVGELFITWNSRWKTSSDRVAVACRDTLQALNVPLDLNLDQVGWMPPYATDPEILAAWRMRSHEVHGGDVSGVCRVYGGCRSIGELLRRSNHGRRYLHNLPSIGHIKLYPLMYVPAAWIPPHLDPECCASYGKEEWNGLLISSSLADALRSKGFATRDELETETAISLDRKKFLSWHKDEIGDLASAGKIRLRDNTPAELRETVLGEEIEALELSVAAYNTLRSLGLVILGDVVQKTETELLKHSGRRRVVWEIKEALDRKGLHLGMSLE